MEHRLFRLLLLERPLLTSIWNRRTHRMSRGSSIEAGSLSWTSDESREPLTDLEEAILPQSADILKAIRETARY